jgi:glucose/arabinose dehydrogenase
MRPSLVLPAVALLAFGAACSPDEATSPEATDAPTDAPTDASADGPADDPEDDPDADEPADDVDDADPGTDGADGADGTDEAAPVEVVTGDVVTGLEAPWDLVLAADDRVLVTERDTGRLLEVEEDGSVTTLRTFEVDASGEGGLLGLAVHPDDDTVVYAYLTAAQDNRVVRFSLDDATEPEPVVTGIPKARIHNGGRIAFGPDGMLHVATGDAAEPALAPDPSSLAGKILRVTPEGEVPDDNPGAGSPVYSLGHRNVQGLTWDADGTLWAAELGPDVDDEINRIEPGADHGWPAVTGAPGDDRYVDAAFVAQPPEASWSGAVVLHDGGIPQWEGDLFVAALRGQRLWRFELEDGAIVDHEELLVGEHGRLRTVVIGPDGALWVLTSNRDGRGSPADGDDRVLRLGPAGS